MSEGAPNFRVALCGTRGHSFAWLSQGVVNKRNGPTPAVARRLPSQLTISKYEDESFDRLHSLFHVVRLYTKIFSHTHTHTIRTAPTNKNHRLGNRTP